MEQEASKETENTSTLSPFTRKKERLAVIAIILTIVNVAGTLFEASTAGKQGAELVGYAVGSVLWPLILVAVSQIFPLCRRNNYIMLNVYSWSSALIMMFISLKPFIALVMTVLTS